MPFDIDNVEEGRWFDFFESEIDLATGDIIYDDHKEDTAEFCIRHPGPFIEARLNAMKKESKMVLNSKSRTMEKVSSFPDQTPDEAKAEREDMIDYSITDIRNAKKPDGTDIECTKENKLKLKKIPAFDRFLARVWEILENAKASEEKASEKN